MADTELGRGYVQIIPRATGISKAIEGQIAPAATVAGTKASKGIAKALGGGFKRAGGMLTNFVTKPILGVGAALAGAAIWKGWKRVTELNDARVKLEAIGIAAKDVESIEKSAMKAVKGTAFAQNEAMTTAATASAAGVKSGREMTKYLSAIADAAAVAGTDMSDMGYIFNSVATKNKASNKELKEMANRGIPIYQYLAKEIGVTTEEVFNMAKKGEIDLKTFRDAVANNIGGAAAEMGWKTFSGAVNNTMAALARVGAAFFGADIGEGSFVDIIIPKLRAFSDYLDKEISPKVAEFGEKFRKAFQGLSSVLGNFTPEQIVIGLGALAALGPGLSLVGNIMMAWGPISGILTGIGTAATGLVGALPALGGAFQLLLHPLSTLQLLVMGIPTLLSSLPGIIAHMGTAIVGALTSPLAIGAMIVGGIVLIVATSQKLRASIMGLVSGVLPPLMGIMQAVGSVISVLVTEIVSIAKTIGDNLAPIIKQLTPLVVTVVSVIAAVIIRLAPTVISVIKVISAAIKAAVVVIAGTISAVITIIGGIVSAVKAAVKGAIKAWNSLVKGTKAAFSKVKAAIQVMASIGSILIKLAGNMVKGAVSKFQSMVGKVKSTFNSIKNAATAPFKSMVSIISSAVAKVKSFFPINLGSIVSKLRIPQLKVSGGKAPWGIGGEGSMPRIYWAAKGAIVDGAQLIGAGEKGAEAIVPLNPFWKKLEEMNTQPETTYNISVNVDAQDLDGVMSVKEFLRMLQRAKQFA